MKKEFILVGLLAVGFASAQTDKDHLGKVGINIMTPQATMDIRPNDDNRQETATTNEGILIPKLSKTRVANIKDVLLVEGTLVYVTDDASSTIASYAGTNAKVAKITEKGYYYYNGTEWVKVAIGSSISANLYTADGVLTGNRKVVMGDKILSFEGSDNAKYLEVKNASWYPLVVNSTNAQGGGIAVHPNNLENRIELSANTKGDMRFYQHGNGDVMFVQKSTNRVGIGTETPKAKLDVNGGVRVLQGTPQGDGTNLGYAFGNDGDTGLFATADPTYSNISTNLDLYVNNVSRVNINQQGDVKVTNLAGDGDKIVVANNDGTLIKGVSVNSFATSNIYTADGTTNGDRTVSTANGFLTIKGNAWNPLVVNSEIVPSDPANNARGGIAIHPNDMEKRVEFATTVDGDSRIWLDGDKLFIKRATGNVGIGTNEPVAKLDVTGDIIARGLAQTDAYIGGDNFPAAPGLPMNDVEIGSIKAGIEDVSLYNRADAKTMNLYANNMNAFGSLKSATLAGGGDKIVVANNDGTLTKGISVSSFATSNLYTANGVLSSDRVVNQAGKWLDFNDGGVRITGNNGVYFPLTVNAMASGGNGGISIQPNGDHIKRVELNTTPEGNFRLWADGDKVYVNRATGNVSLSAGVNPAARLDVSGEVIARGQTGQIEAYFGGDGVGNDVELGSIKSGVTDVTLYNRADSKAMKLVSGAVEARGAIKSTTLAGTGDRVVLADATGVLKTGTLPASSLSTPVRTVAAAYTLAVADNNGYVYVNSTSPITVTVPSALPAGFSCVIIQQGAGQVTIAGNGVTLQTARGTKTRTRYSAVGVIKRTTAEATITGDAIN